MIYLVQAPSINQEILTYKLPACLHVEPTNFDSEFSEKGNLHF